MLLLKGLDLLSQLTIEEVAAIMEEISSNASNDNQPTDTAKDTNV